MISEVFGPSDRVRTCGLMVPNHPRYQLRYTRLFDFRFQKFSLSVVIPVVKGVFAASFRQRRKPANIGAARLSGIGAGHGSDTGAALPNHPRYQLRYTRILFYFTTKPAQNKGNFSRHPTGCRRAACTYLKLSASRRFAGRRIVFQFSLLCGFAMQTFTLAIAMANTNQKILITRG